MKYLPPRCPVCRQPPKHVVVETRSEKVYRFASVEPLRQTTVVETVTGYECAEHGDGFPLKGWEV